MPKNLIRLQWPCEACQVKGRKESLVFHACIVPMVEYDLGKIEVMSSSLIAGSTFMGVYPNGRGSCFRGSVVEVQILSHLPGISRKDVTE